MQRNPLTFIACALLGLVMMGIAMWVAVVVATRGPFVGQTSHDFGTVMMPPGEKVRLEHTYRLTNRMGKAVTVQAVRPDCGCLTSITGPTTVEPGGLFELPIVMSTSSRQKKVLIHLDLGDDGMQTLRATAAIRYEPRLTSSVKHLTLGAARITDAPITAYIYDTYDQPAAPEITATEGLRVTFSGWHQARRPNDPRVVPCVWEGRISVNQDAQATIESGSITLELKPARPLHLSVSAQPQQ